MDIPTAENASTTTIAIAETAAVEVEDTKNTLAADVSNASIAADMSDVSNSSDSTTVAAVVSAADAVSDVAAVSADSSTDSFVSTNSFDSSDPAVTSEPMVVAAPLPSAAASVSVSTSMAPPSAPTPSAPPMESPVTSAPPIASAPPVVSAAPEESAKEPQLSDYLNYRDFLRSFYLYKREITKGHHRRYNYSFFSAAADIRSPNYLRLIIEGQRNLSEEMAFKFARAMQLNKEATDEFVLMVLYSQETDPMLRNQYLKTLSDFRLQKGLRLGVIDKKVMEKVPNWIGWILFTLLDQEGARFTSATLKHLLRNKASETEIQNALNKLLESGELALDADTGEVKKGRTQVEAGDDIPADLIRRLQTQLMSLGLESLFQDSPLDREFGTLTLSLTKKEFEDLRFQLRKFRKQIHKDNSIQRMQSKGERVYQLNLQLYPVTDRSQTIAELENN